MQEPEHQAERYRLKAEELRAISEDWKSVETTVMLANLVRLYEKMAEDLECMAKADGIGPR